MSVEAVSNTGYDYYYSPLSRPEEVTEVGSLVDESNPNQKGLEREDTVELSSKVDEKEEKAGEQELTDEEKKDVLELKKRDLEVRAHEQAHIAAGGAHVRGGASYSYQTGPDGKRYAVGGEVSIDTSAVSGDPQATITKMQVIRKAALAPGNPSSTDRSVAAAASQKMNSARMDLAKEKVEELEESDKKTENSESNVNAYNNNGNIESENVDIGNVVDLSA